ncbi:MAG: hypothetical protein HXK83_07055 [Lachnospiraceae bacterium]|nr:hypothetical protein [Lachnospiraceae bacterium]
MDCKNHWRKRGEMSFSEKMKKIIKNGKKGGWTPLRRMARKRMSFPASLTVEGALIIPIFLYFFINMNTLFDIMRVQGEVEAALHQTGNKMAIQMFDVKYGASLIGMDDEMETSAGDLGTSILSTVYASSKVKDYLGRYCKNMNCVVGQKDGIGFLRSGFFSDGDIIDLVADYQVQPLIKLYGFDVFPMEARYYGHAWTGYRIPGTEEKKPEESSETVYVTRHGTAYHRDPSCTYISREVHSRSREELDALRNASGAKYYPCERCRAQAGSGPIYVTDYGTCYHSSPGCTQLERSVTAISLEQALAQGYCPCSKCGNQ